MSLVDPDNDPPIDLDAFPDAEAGLYWSSTPSAIDPEGDSWDIAFYAEAPGVANPSSNVLNSNVRLRALTVGALHVPSMRTAA